MKCLSVLLFKMMIVEELIDVIGIVIYDKFFIFWKYFKCLFLIGKNVLFIYIKDLFIGIFFLLKKELILVILKYDLEEFIFEKVVKW